MALNDITFQRQNGGMGRTAASEDPVSGLLLGMNSAVVSTSSVLTPFASLVVGSVTLYVATLKYYEQLEATYGITRTEASDDITAEQAAKNFIDYHVSEFFKHSPSGTLYLAVKLTGDVLPAEISAMQNYAGGKIRQVGIAAAGTAAITAEQLTGYQTEAGSLETNHMPLSILVAQRKGAYDDIGDITAVNLSLADRRNVSVLISQDLDATLQAEQNSSKLNEVAAIGTLLGCVSAASVNESIAWVQKFPVEMKAPGFVTGDLLKETTTTNLNLLNDNRYIFVRSHVGVSYVYFNDSHTLDVSTSDYAYIENVRTMDKATRGIRANMLPYLNAPLDVDATSGHLRADTVAALETVVGKALEEMEKAGELSGYSAVIDPDQNVLSTSEVTVVIRNVAVGVMRQVKVKIGFTTSLS
ncbi:MAG TPA: DUF2586 family protein [Paludibacteraceae bacterium]|nr:DUF2586 family protein [Paludibacteraceae bacterium]